MPKANPQYVKETFSQAQGKAALRTSDPAKLALFAPLMKGDYAIGLDDECNFALDTNKWTTAVTAGGGPTAFAYSAVRGGIYLGATGTTDNDVTAIHAATTCVDPADKPWFMIRFLSTVVTGFSLEIGWSDPKTAENLPGCSDIDDVTIGNGVTEIAAVHMDTDQTLTTCALVGDGTTGAAVKTSITTPAGVGFTPTAAVYQTWIIGCEPNKANCVIWNGDQYIGKFSTTNGPDSGVLVRPYALFRTRDTATKSIWIDHMLYGWERA